MEDLARQDGKPASSQRVEFAYGKLVANLEDLTKSYRSILEMVRRERELLIAADLEKLREHNIGKETALYKLKALDSARERYARELADQLGADSAQPRLLELAQKISGDRGDRLRTIHATLELLVRRASELNRTNEEYARSALSGLSGALENIKDTLVGKQTYEKKGRMAYGPEKTGNFVRREG